MSEKNKIDLESFKLIVETVLDAKNPELLGSQLTLLLVGLLEIKGAAFFIVNPRKEELEILAAHGLSQEYKAKGSVLMDRSIKHESNLEPVVIQDTQDTDRLQYPEQAEKEGIRSIVSFPVKLHGKIIGALRIYHSEVWDVNHEELGYLQVLSKNLALALKAFRLSADIVKIREALEDIHPIWL